MHKTIIGIGVSQGNAIGKVAFYGSMNTMDEPSILVVPELNRTIVTNIARNVTGIIAEKGSIGCHGAGLLREMGIPCIIKNFDVEERLIEGDIVEIIGNSGLIKVYDLSIGGENKCWESISQEQAEVCYRPNRIYQRLRFDILKDGWESSPQFLFHLPMCKLDLKHGVVYIHNAPKLSEIKDVILKNPDEYLILAKKRAFDIQKITFELNEINNNIEYSDLKRVYTQFIQCIGLYRDLLKYIYMTQFISDDLTEDIVRIIANISSETGVKEKYINNNLHSDYVKNAVKENYYPGVSTTWTIPAREPHIWKGKINWKHNKTDLYLVEEVMSASMESGFDICYNFCVLNVLVPIIYQLSEEHYHVSSSICSYLNKFIEIFAKYLVDRGIISTGEEILEMPLTELQENIGKILDCCDNTTCRI